MSETVFAWKDETLVARSFEKRPFLHKSSPPVQTTAYASGCKVQLAKDVYKQMPSEISPNMCTQKSYSSNIPQWQLRNLFFVPLPVLSRLDTSTPVQVSISPLYSTAFQSGCCQVDCQIQAVSVQSGSQRQWLNVRTYSNFTSLPSNVVSYGEDFFLNYPR